MSEIGSSLPMRRGNLHPTDESKLVPHVDYLERELSFHSQYEKEIDWKVYQSQRSKRLEIERWVESLINATLDISKMFLTPAAESHGLWPWMNAPTFGRDVAPLGRQSGTTGFARGAPQ